MKSWSDKEIVDLFNQIENYKSQNLPMKDAFKAYAKIYNRKPNSVRNYYYFELENLKNDEKKREKLKIDLKNHVINNFELFDRDSESKMLNQINELTSKGLSVRTACLKLADGDLTKMTRYQNKYQNMKRKANNIIKFEKKDRILTDQDINGLFMGLVKLIKKNAIEDYVQNDKFQRSLLQKVVSDLEQKDQELLKLKEDFQKLKLENEFLKKYKQKALKNHLSQSLEKQIKKENI